MNSFEFKTSSGDIVIISTPDDIQDKILVAEKPKYRPIKLIMDLPCPKNPNIRCEYSKTKSEDYNLIFYCSYNAKCYKEIN